MSKKKVIINKNQNKSNIDNSSLKLFKINLNLEKLKTKYYVLAHEDESIDLFREIISDFIIDDLSDNVIYDEKSFEVNGKLSNSVLLDEISNNDKIYVSYTIEKPLGMHDEYGVNKTNIIEIFDYQKNELKDISIEISRLENKLKSLKHREKYLLNRQ